MVRQWLRRPLRLNVPLSLERPPALRHPLDPRPVTSGAAVRGRWALLFVVFCAGGAWMGYDPGAGKSFVPAEPLSVAQTRVKPVPVVPVEEPVASPVKPVDPAASECGVPALDPLGAPWLISRVM